jgi:hypothetical protein
VGGRVVGVGGWGGGGGGGGRNFPDRNDAYSFIALLHAIPKPFLHSTAATGAGSVHDMIFLC